MAGKTISAYVSEEVAGRIERLAEVEDRKVSQVAAAALSLYTALPPEAHAALRRLEMLGQPMDVKRAMRHITHVLLEGQYEIARRDVVESMDTASLGALDSEEAIVEAATSLSSRPRAVDDQGSATKAVRPRAERTRSRAKTRRRSGRS